jgi:hypothetical protein
MTALLQRTRSCGAPSGATDSAGSPKHCGSEAKPHCCRIKRTRLQRRTVSADPWIWRVARGVLGAWRCRTRVAAGLVISPVQNDVIALIGAWPPSVGRSKVARGSAQIIQQSGTAVLPSCRAVDERFGRGRVTPRSGLDVISRSWREFHIRALRPRGTEGSNRVGVLLPRRPVPDLFASLSTDHGSNTCGLQLSAPPARANHRMLIRIVRLWHSA